MAAPTDTPDPGAPTAAAKGPGAPVHTAGVYRPQLDGIRALAVVAVIVFHLGAPWLPGGFVGVDVFFVLSGYLITGILLSEAATTGTVGLWRFYARRARRLLPASILVLLTVVVATEVLLDGGHQASIGKDVTWSALYSANWRFVSGGVDYFTPGDVPSPVQHFWSLAVEEQFYLVWPLAFLGLWRLSTRRRGPDATGLLLGVLVALTAVGAYLSVVNAGSTYGYFATHIRAYQLLAGAVLAVAVARWRDLVPRGAPARWAGTVLAVVGVSALAWEAKSIDGSDTYPGRDGLLVTAASLLLIVGVDVLPAGLATRVVGAAPAAYVGRLSYSLYLWHWPVIVFAPVVAEKQGIRWLDSTWAAVILTVTISLASFYLVERPVRFRLRPTAPKPAVIAIGLATSLIVALVAVPVLQPRDAFAREALSTLADSAPPGPCPYSREQWGPPSTSEPCLYRQGGPVTLALVGDSHAQQWQPAIDEIAERHDLTVVRITRRGCPANALTVQSYDDQGIVRTDVPCSLWRDRVYPATIEEFDPDIVFVETRSHEWAFRDGDRTVEPGDDDHERLWAESWEPTLDVLTSGGAQVFLSLTLPNMPFRVPACLSEEGPDSDDCDVPLADDTGVMAFNDLMRDAARGRDGVTVVDPTPIVCPDGICPAVIDGEIVHRDDDHISASFAEAAAGDFEAMLTEAGARFTP